MRVGDRRQRGFVDRAGEALHGVVAGVHLHQQGGAPGDGVLVVVRVGAVGGADLDQPRAGAGHDVGHAKGAADFHQLAARDDHLAPARQRRQHQQHGGGVVVDHGGGLGAGQLAQQAFDDAVAVAPAAAGEVVFEVVGPGHHGPHVGQRGFGQQGAAQVGVDHRAGEVEHAAQGGCQAMAQAIFQLLRQAAGGDPRGAQRARQRLGAQRGEQGARLGGDQGVAMLLHQRGHAVLAQQPVERRQLLGLDELVVWVGGVGGMLGGLRTVDHGFFGRGHQGAPASASSAASASPNSSSRLTPWRSKPESDTSRSSVTVARSSATGSPCTSLSRCTTFR